MNDTTITPQLLRSKRACKEQLHIFETRWPGGAEVTLENCQEAARLELDLGWASQRLLSAPAREAFRVAIALAREAYDATLAPTREAYKEALATAGKAYSAALATAFCAAWLIDHPVGAEA